tara:strand:+ start:815 stop:1027 length:213 start_codon:yes stop_codon:yes gene_type:complete
MGKELNVIGTDNRDSVYTTLQLENGDYVEVNVINLFQNILDNQEIDVDVNKLVETLKDGDDEMFILWNLK